ncbi:hypothetical protein DEJ01_09815 [Curtobacterium sp. MCLR17_040]|uniref:hypothetical protein n=1 Tax=Curtobacterium sp. MCLR17_040 TaxID=2175625 RepID=UPI000DA7526B|nr:hypothetical protein [Curtobacterium sp. MCLR17_040]PZF02813.1 hypothetical protein DEJ01_09815 [Curtobacterium sp. MCLR17_040]
MGPALQWVADAYAGRPQITLPYGLGDTADLTDALAVLKLAGLHAFVESHDTLRLADGRRARFPSLTQRPRDEPDAAAELLLLAPQTVTQIALAEQTATVLLVDVDRRRVWVDGKQVLGVHDRWKDAAPIYITFAVARMLAVNGSTFEGLVRSGLTPGQIDDALARLGKRVHRTDIGWESRKIGGLIDFAIACYPGPGGIRTRWRSDLPLPEQAERLIAAGCINSGRSISDRPGYPAITKRPTPYRLVAFSRDEVDMTGLGFESEGPTAASFIIPADVSSIADEDEQWASTELVIPADPTIFHHRNRRRLHRPNRRHHHHRQHPPPRRHPQRRRQPGVRGSARQPAVPRRHRLRPSVEPAELKKTRHRCACIEPDFLSAN